MVAIKAKFNHGKIDWKESPPSVGSCDLIVIFSSPEKSVPSVSRAAKRRCVEEIHERFNHTQASHDFPAIIDDARKNGLAMIRWLDGTLFSLRPEFLEKSPFDVPGVKIDITRDEILSIIREGRER
jgi:hypothetical protein